MVEPSTGSIDALIGGALPDLMPDARLTLASIARDDRPAAGSYLMREGRPTLDLGLIVEGRLGVRDRIGTDDVTLMTLEPGDVFGWSAVLDGISIEALSLSTVISDCSANTRSPGLTSTSMTATSLKSPMSGTLMSMAGMCRLSLSI